MHEWQICDMDWDYVFECVRKVLDLRNSLNDKNKVNEIKIKENYMKKLISADIYQSYS